VKLAERLLEGVRAAILRRRWIWDTGSPSRVRLPAAEKDRALSYIENDPARLKGFAWLLYNMDEFIYIR
jgi:hypothetical protein